MTSKEKLTQIIVDLPGEANSTRAFLLLGLIQKLGDRLEKAPASSAVRYHNAYEGGLLEHVLEVNEICNSLAKNLPEEMELSPRKIITVSLLHDICKVGDGSGEEFYVENILQKGRSKAEPYKINQEGYLKEKVEGPSDLQYLLENFPRSWSHGETSLALLHSVMPSLLKDLEDDEIQAILYHDGGYGEARRGAGIQGKEKPLMITLHCADMLSSRSKNWEKLDEAVKEG